MLLSDKQSIREGYRFLPALSEVIVKRPLLPQNLFVLDTLPQKTEVYKWNFSSSFVQGKTQKRTKTCKTEREKKTKHIHYSQLLLLPCISEMVQSQDKEWIKFQKVNHFLILYAAARSLCK